MLDILNVVFEYSMDKTSVILKIEQKDLSQIQEACIKTVEQSREYDSEDGQLECIRLLF